jgi:hypothetical protein
MPDSGDFVLEGSTSLPTAGSYVVTATLDLIDMVRDENTVICELRHNSNSIGGGRTALSEGYLDQTQTGLDFGSLTFIGGAQAAAGDQISVWCRAEGHDSEPSASGHMMILQVGGFF